MTIVLSVLPRFTTFDYPFGILWPLYFLSFFDFVLSVIPRFSTYDYPFGIFWPLCCLYFLDIRFMIILLVSCGHCIVCPSSIYDFWLPLWYLVAVVLSVLPRLTNSDYPFGILWPLYFLSFLDLRLLITPLVSFGHCVVCTSSIYDLWLSFWYLVAIVMSVLPRFTTSDYSFGILWPFYCLSFLGLRLLITPLVSCGHSIVCPSSIYDFWLPFWYLVAIVLSVLPRFTTSDYHPFCIFWPLYCLSLLDLRLLITPLVSCGRCIVCPSSIYDFWLPLWYLVAIVFSSFLDLRFLITPLVSCGHCIFCHSSILHCLSFLDFRLLITPLVSFGLCVVCTSSIYDLWLSFWYLVAIVLSVRPRFTTSDYPFGILRPLYCLSFLD